MKRLVKHQQGQALIELIIFLPLMITLYSVIGGFASSINGSINQQKITRSYFYYRVQNNSTIPTPKVGDFDNWKTFGMFFIGWRDKYVNGDSPVMPCFKITIPFKENPADKCEDAYSETKTLWIRVGTIYGICGATYAAKNKRVYLIPDGDGMDYKEVVDKKSCLITQ